jgi:hypothetical protein
MLKYIGKISEKKSLPVIIAGDFNVEIKAIETLASVKGLMSDIANDLEDM